MPPEPHPKSSRLHRKPTVHTEPADSPPKKKAGTQVCLSNSKDGGINEPSRSPAQPQTRTGRAEAIIPNAMKKEEENIIKNLIHISFYRFILGSFLFRDW